jgi:hypothetical protein
MTDLPPLDQPQAYVVVGPNDQRGPYTLELLIGEVLAGRLHEATPVWWPGLAEWTTMNAHPGVAAELARRRAAYADPQAYAAPAPAPAPAPGQYEQAQYGGYDTAAPGQPTQPVSGQDYSADMYAGEQLAANPAVDPTPVQDAVAPVSPVVEPVQAGEAAPAEAMGATQLAGETVPAEVAGGDTADVYAAPAPSGWTVNEPSPAPEVVSPDQVQAPEPGSTVSPEHVAAFGALVDRSRERSAAGVRVAAVDTALADATVAAAQAQGFSQSDRTTGDANHDLRFDGGPGETLGISLGRITGDDLAGLRGGHVPLTVRFQSATYGGDLDAGSGSHGEVVIVSDEWSGQATSTVSVLLSLEDYVREDLSVDDDAVRRDVGAAVAVVRSRLS